MRAKRNQTFIRLLLFIQKYWFGLILLLGGVLALPHIIRYFKKQAVKNEKATMSNETELNSAQNAVFSPIIQKQKAVVIQKKYPKLSRETLNKCETYASRIANALGTDAWTEHPLFGVSFLPLVFDKFDEDEAEVVRVLKKCPGTFPIVADIYYTAFTRSRNLRKDIYMYLSKAEIESVRKTYKKYGKTWI